MTGFTQVFGGQTIYPSQLTYRAYALTADITLVWPLNAAVSTNIAPDIMDVTPSGAGFSVLMPDATGTGPGQSILATNLGASAYTLKDNAGGTIQSIAAGTAWDIYLTDNSTVAGTWRAVQRGATTSSASAAALAGLGLIALGSVLNETMAVTTFNSDYGPGSADRAKAFVWTGGSGTLTIAQASTLTSGWFITVRNAGSGVLTVAMAHLGDMINGATTLTLNQGDSCTIFTDNVSAFYTMGLGQAAEFAFDTITIDIGGSGNYVLSGNELNRISYTFTGALTGDRKVVVPDTVQQYWPTNSTTGAHTLTMGNSAQVSSVTLTAGSSNILKDDGANLALAQNGSGFATPVAVADGGTGATTAAGALINLGGTTVGIALFNAASTSAGRTALALGTISTQDANNVTITGGSVTGITDITVADGGTGASTAAGARTNLGLDPLLAQLAGRNMIINGGMQINQRVVTTGAADDTYINDRFYILTQTGPITISQLSNPTNGVPSAVRLTQAQAGAQRMGCAHIIESVNCRNARGQAVASNWWVTSSTSQNIRYAILEWTGTADVVTSDVVLDWTSGTYTPNNFFLTANLTVTAVGVQAVTAATPVVLSALSGTVGSSDNNSIVFIWTESTCAQNVTLDLSMVQYALGTTLGSFVWPQQPEVLAQCQRYYQKSYNQSVKPGTFTTNGATQLTQGVGASTLAGGFTIFLPVSMRPGSPSLSIFNPSAIGGSNQVFNYSTNTACTGTSSAAFEGSITVSFTSPGGSAVANGVGCHYTAESEL